MRPYQWSKNLLVFVPLVAAHNFLNWPSIFLCILAFICMSLTASAVYALNDVLDVEADRKHPRKSLRPVAAGQISPKGALSLSLSCFLLAAGFLFLLPLSFSFYWLSYLLLVAIYIFGLKRVPGIDVILLTLFYILRIYLGGAAIEISPSGWVLSFAACTFLSLALMKRSSEVLQNLQDTKRPYGPKSFFALNMAGITLSVLAGGILLMYASSRQAASLYQQPVYIYAAAPLVWLWFARAWTRTIQGKMTMDPVDF
ncbi:MAG: UbiA prenyltransferase family protein, partial [Chthoniobacterales bacterium]